LTRAARVLGLVLLCAVSATLAPGRLRADPQSRRMLDGLRFARRGDAWEMRIAFHSRIRYLRHAPRTRGTTLEIQVDPLALSFADLPMLASHEALTPDRDAPVPLADVVYEGHRSGDKVVVLRFTRPVGFEVRQGEDFRSLVVTVREEALPPQPAPAPATPRAPPVLPPPVVEPPRSAMPAPTGPSPAPLAGTPTSGAAEARSVVPPAPAPSPGRFAVELQTTPPGTPLPVLPPSPALAGRSLYASSVQQDGRALQRVRAGLFADRPSAERAAAELAASFPGAFVVDLDAESRGTLARGAAPAPAPSPAREAAAPGEPAPVPRAPVAWSPPPGPASDAVRAQSAALLEAGRAALTANDADAAVRAFTKVLGFPEHEATAEAKELLGVARERRGQLAHAKAEYQEYLAHWSDGEGAARVRQRLDALLTAQARPPAPPGGAPRAPGGGSPVQWSGSLSTQGRYEALHDGVSGTRTLDTSLYTDFLLLSRARTERWNLRSQAAGSYRYDFLDGPSGSEARVGSLFVDASQREGPYSLVAGRQPGNSGGVNGRFDGVRLGRRLGERWKLSALAGTPVELRDSDRIETGRFLYGVSLDALRLFGRVDGQVFAIQQHADGLVDRTGVGGELRYADETRFAAAYVDYDVLFGSLNTALLTGSWQLTPKTGLNLLVDHRNTPILASWNAIQGQPVGRVGDLRSTYSDAEIRRLAEDRTARSTTASLGATRQLGERFQLAVDVSAARLGSTPASGGVDAMEGTGWEIAYYPQLVATGLLTEGDVGTLGVRYFDGDTANVTSFIVSERYPVSRALRLSPRLRIDWRDSVGRDEFAPSAEDLDADPVAAASAARVRRGSLTVRPFFGLEYRIGRVTLDTDAGFEWTTGGFTAGGGDEYGWSLTSGVRYDF